MGTVIAVETINCICFGCPRHFGCTGCLFSCASCGMAGLSCKVEAEGDEPRQRRAR